MDEWKMRPIGYIRSPYKDTQADPQGTWDNPHDGGNSGGSARIRKRPPGYRRILPSHDYLDFSQGARASNWWGKIQRMDCSMEYFATRSPRRPNAIGLTTVELVRREGASLHLKGIDMLDGTPVLDIKPYTSSVPMEQTRRGWLEEAEKKRRRLHDRFGIALTNAPRP